MKRAVFAVVLGIVLTQGRDAAAAVLGLESTSITRVAGQTTYTLDIFIAPSVAGVSEYLKGVAAAFSITGPANGPLISSVVFDDQPNYNYFFANEGTIQDYPSGTSYIGLTANIPAAAGLGAGTSRVKLSSSTEMAQVTIDTTDVSNAGGTWTFNFSDTAGNATHFFDNNGNPLAPTSANPVSFSLSSITPSAVPEPATWAGLATMVGVGAPFIVWRYRKLKQASKDRQRRRHRSHRSSREAKPAPDASPVG